MCGGGGEHLLFIIMLLLFLNSMILLIGFELNVSLTFLKAEVEKKEIAEIPKCVFLRDNEGFFDKTKEFKSRILKSFN